MMEFILMRSSKPRQAILSKFMRSGPTTIRHSADEFLLTAPLGAFCHALRKRLAGGTIDAGGGSFGLFSTGRLARAGLVSRGLARRRKQKSSQLPA